MKEKFVVVDIEADGPIPGPYSMVSFGAVIVEPTLSKTFYGEVKPISTEWNSLALAVSGINREQHELFREPKIVMQEFKDWLNEHFIETRPIFVSDNLAFDWQWINWYFHKYLESNPFGYSGRRIGDIWCGYKNDLRYNWKKHRKTKHTHNPVDDAKGNAEALLELLLILKHK